jgi:predicted lipoprotein with Yx(FWY)xxD motif
MQLGMMRHLVLFIPLAYLVAPAAAQGTLGQLDSGSVQEKAPQQTVINDALSLGVTGRRGREYLFGYNGMPVYIYSKDRGAQSTCYGDCAVRWPPYIVGAQDDLGPKAGVEGKVDTTRRSDGNLQLTYNGRPLYFYAADKDDEAPAGHRVNGLWHLVRP